MENGNGKWIEDQMGQAMPTELGRIREEAIANAAIATASRDAEIEKAVAERIAAPGALDLPKLLDQRRIEWAITDGAFKLAMVYDRVLIYQIPEDDTKEGKMGKDSVIWAPDQTKDRLKHECPRGVLIGAGVKALDALRSHGIDLGHIVYYIASQPWRLQFDYIAGKRVTALPMNAGDIIGSEDLQRDLRDRKCMVTTKVNEAGFTEHLYQDAEGKTWSPVLPWQSADSI